MHRQLQPGGKLPKTPWAKSKAAPTTTITRKKSTHQLPKRRNNSHSLPNTPPIRSSHSPTLRTAIPFDKVPVKFTDLGLAPEIADTLYSQGIVAPSTIQKQSIPAILEGGDVCITAQTGQGKTLAYTLPLIQKLVEDEAMGKVSLPSAPRALILVPTRELAMQVEKTTKALSHANGFRLRSRAITGDQSPSYMRQILRGEHSNESIALLNSTEAKVRDQIRLAATVSSRVINNFFKDYSWTYHNNESVKKINRKVQQQMTETATEGIVLAKEQLTILCEELAQLQSNNTHKSSDDENVRQLEKQIQSLKANIAKFEADLKSIDTLSHQSNPVQHRNWSQIKRNIKRETTRFAYALFAMSQDFTHVVDKLNHLGINAKHQHANMKKPSPLANNIQRDNSISSTPFNIPLGDLEVGLNVNDLFLAEPLAIRTLANEYVTALASNHLHDDSRTANSVHLPVPLMPLDTATSSALDGRPFGAAKPKKQSFKPIQILLPSRQEVVEKQANQTRLHSTNLDNPDSDDMFAFSENEQDVAMRSVFEATDGFTPLSQLAHKVSQGIQPNFTNESSIDGQSELILRSSLLQKNDKRKKKINLEEADAPPNKKATPFLDDVDDDIDDDIDDYGNDRVDFGRDQFGRSQGVNGDYYILNRSNQAYNAIIDTDDEYAASVDDAIRFAEQESQQTLNKHPIDSTQQSEPHESKEPSEFEEPDEQGFHLQSRGKKNHFSLDDHVSNRSFFLDVDYITRIVLQSLQALAPGVVKYQDTTSEFDGMVINHEKLKKNSIDNLDLNYPLVAQAVHNYIINLPTTELLDLSFSIGQDGEEDSFLHQEAKTNDPTEYQNANSALYHKDRLQRNLDVLICTPARLIQLVQWRAIKLGKVNYVVLDEADLLLTSRTHIPQNVKTAFQQLSQDQKQNVSKHLDASSKSPLNQMIQDLQIRNGELYQAMIPLLTRLKTEYEFHYGFIPQVQHANTVFRQHYSSSLERHPSEFHQGFVLAKQKRLEQIIKAKHPHLYIKSPEFQHLFKQYQTEESFDDYGTPLSKTNLDVGIKKALTQDSLDDETHSNNTIVQKHNLLSELENHDDTLDQKDKAAVSKYIKLSRTIEPIQFIYTSATLSSSNTQFHQEIVKVNPLYSEQYHPRPLQQITTQDALCLPTSLKQTFIQVGTRDKLEILAELLDSPELNKNKYYFPTQTMVFCNTISSARAVSHALIDKGISCTSVHSGVPPRHRADNWDNFFNNRVGVMVATDIASRGVHHPSIRYIINFDFPLNAVDYLHRAGRATTLPGHVGSMRYKTKTGANNSRAITEHTQFITLGDSENIEGVQHAEDIAHSSLDKAEATNPNRDNSDGLQTIILDNEGKPVQKRGEVISLVNKADQVLAFAINEATKQLAPITSLSSDKKDYVIHPHKNNHSHDSARAQTRDEERILSTSSKGYKEAKDKLIRSLQGVDVFMGGQAVTKPQLVQSAIRKAAKEHILHRDRFSNVSHDKRRVDRHSDKRRAEDKHIRQQTEYAATMGFDKPLLSKTAKINAEYPDRVLHKKIDLSLQDMRERSHKQRQHQEKLNDLDRKTTKKFDDFNVSDKVVSRRSPTFMNHNNMSKSNPKKSAFNNSYDDSIPTGMGKAPKPYRG
jgi:superfamily II DNA/RNA helicase